MPIFSTATSAYANTSNLAAQRSASSSITLEPGKSAAKDDKSAPSASGVVVTLSAQARNVGDPATSGEQKSFGQVASDARASMDAQYATMKASGKPFNWDRGSDWSTLMEGLDRRSLYAIRSNEGGQFTKDEQVIARTLMGWQEGAAMGLQSKSGTFVSSTSNFSDSFKSGIHFLDSVSSEEKSSVEWAIERASAQIAYESAAETERKIPEKLDSENPLVQLITAAMKSMKHHPSSGMTTGSLTTIDDLKRQPWFKGVESRLDQVLQQLQEKPLLQDIVDSGNALGR